jgi:hypothetical protein
MLRILIPPHPLTPSPTGGEGELNLAPSPLMGEGWGEGGHCV